MMRELNQVAPIVLFCFNRPKHTAKVLSALAKNYFAANSDLYIFCDGPRFEADMLSIIKVYDVVENAVGFRNVHIRKSQYNKGLADSVIEGVTEIVQLHGRVIVLEDDLVTSPYFLKYMNDALVCYKDEEQVISIHGYTYPVMHDLPETFFLKGADCWGWATWKRGWELFEQNGSRLLEELCRQKLAVSFDFENSYPYIKMLKAQIAGKNNSWAIRWYASAFLKNKLTLYPGTSLVLNIGMDDSGTHCSSAVKHEGELAHAPIRVGAIPIEDSAIARQAFINFHLKSRTNLFTKVFRKLAAIVQRQVGLR